MQLMAERTQFKIDTDLLAGYLPDLGPDEATPRRVFLRAAAESNFSHLAALERELANVHVAYSVKTNPRDEMIDLALRYGTSIEVISPAEWRHVRERGFEPEHILFNGPRPLDGCEVSVAFADSVEAFERNSRVDMVRAHGVRIKPDGISSRFGIESDALREITSLARASRTVTALAVSFFARSQDLGSRSWAGVAHEIVERAELLERVAGKSVTVVDFGGGCAPAEFAERCASALPEMVAFARERLPHLERVYVEPGQEIATPVEAVLAGVLEVRNRGGRHEAVIDAGLSAMPHIGVAEHRIFRYRSGIWSELPEGGDRILGPICMEDDIVKQGVSIAGIREHDILAICDTGAYDSSMAFDFAEGRSKPEAP